MTPNIGDRVVVKAPATFFGSPTSAFGPTDVEGEVTYVHPAGLSYVVVNPFQAGYVDNTCLVPAEGETP